MDEILCVHFSGKPDWKLEPVVIQNTTQRCLGKKPLGGIWLSPVNSEWSWEDWCAENNFADCSQYTRVEMLTSLERALIIDQYEDLDKLPWYVMYPEMPMLGEGVDFEQVKQSGVDVIYLTERGQLATHHPFFAAGRDMEVAMEELLKGARPRDLHGWDCESLLVLDSRAVLDWRITRVAP